MKIAISHWQSKIAPVFDSSNNLILAEVENGQEINREKVVIQNKDTFGKANELSSLGSDVLICGAISYPLETAMVSKGIRVYGFICGDMEFVLAAFLQGQLVNDQFLMPGCYGRKERRGYRHRGGGTRNR